MLWRRVTMITLHHHTLKYLLQKGSPDSTTTSLETSTNTPRGHNKMILAMTKKRRIKFGQVRVTGPSSSPLSKRTYAWYTNLKVTISLQGEIWISVTIHPSLSTWQQQQNLSTKSVYHVWFFLKQNQINEYKNMHYCCSFTYLDKIF